MFSLNSFNSQKCLSFKKKEEKKESEKGKCFSGLFNSYYKTFMKLEKHFGSEIYMCPVRFYCFCCAIGSDHLCGCCFGSFNDAASQLNNMLLLQNSQKNC